MWHIRPAIPLVGFLRSTVHRASSNYVQCAASPKRAPLFLDFVKLGTLQHVILTFSGPPFFPSRLSVPCARMANLARGRTFYRITARPSPFLAFDTRFSRGGVTQTQVFFFLPVASLFRPPPPVGANLLFWSRCPPLIRWRFHGLIEAFSGPFLEPCAFLQFLADFSGSEFRR